MTSGKAVGSGDTMKMLTGRRRSIGLAGSALWLIGISLVFVIWSFVAIGTPLATTMLVGSSILVGVLVVTNFVVIRAALNLPVSMAPKSPEEQSIGRRFARVFGVEILAFAVVNPIVGATGKYELMPALNLIIVGIHFFPLARIFRVPRYNITGFLFCVIPVVTLLAIPREFEIGHVLAWYVVPSLGCGLAATLTAAASLREAWQYMLNHRVG
jgi:hypothetical protein